MDDLSVDPVVAQEGFLPCSADDKHVIGFEDRLALTIDESGSREVINVMNGAHDRRAGAGIAHPGRCPG